MTRWVSGILHARDFDLRVGELLQRPAMGVVNALFPLLYSTDEKTKRHAVQAMGAVFPDIADRDKEAARVIIRRLMWSLNDESGGIGWGSPEAMAEILASHRGMAVEYVHILTSYTREGGNYLEDPVLQRGLLWGIRRLFLVYPDLIRSAPPDILPYLRSQDPVVRGLSSELAGVIGLQDARPDLEGLTRDDTEILLNMDRNEVRVRVRDLALEALQILNTS